ncbi:MAG: TlpA family protein disulfide reductase [Candidatus Bathyarchaeia archaeon]
MATANLKIINKRTVSVEKYINKLAQPFKEKFSERKQTYQLNEEAVRKLKNYAKDVVIVVFSAEWCKECAASVPVLALLAEKTGVKVRVFGGLKTDPLNPKEKWRIPPSPPEVKAFNVRKAPHIIVFDKQGKQLGTIIENPKPENTLEEEILHIILQT